MHHIATHYIGLASHNSFNEGPLNEGPLYPFDKVKKGDIMMTLIV